MIYGLYNKNMMSFSLNCDAKLMSSLLLFGDEINISINNTVLTSI